MGNPTHVEKSFVGSGKFYINGKRVGNVTAAQLAYDIATIELKNSQGGGGLLDNLDRVSKVNLNLTLTNFSFSNLAMALAASIVEEATGEVADEAITIGTNSLADTDYLMNTSVTVTVKDDQGTTIPILDTDGVANYELSASGIVFLGGADVTAADGLVGSVTYTKSPQVLLQALKNTGAEYKLVLDGINDNNGDPHMLRVWRWKPSPTDGLDFIGEDYASLTANGSVLADVSKPVGKSQFFELLQLNKAA